MIRLKEIITEGKDANPADLDLRKQFESAILRLGKFGYTKKDDKYYLWDDGLVARENEYTNDKSDWKWAGNNVDKIFKDCGLGQGYSSLKARFTYYEIISNSEYRGPQFGLYVRGDQQLHGLSDAVDKPTKSYNFSKMVGYVKSNSSSIIQKPDVMKRIFSFWKPDKREERQIGSRDMGYGSAASTIVYKRVDKVYKIAGLDTAFGMNQKEIERFISNHFLFKRDDLKFHWDEGLLVVGGEYSEKWD